MYEEPEPMSDDDIMCEIEALSAQIGRLLAGKGSTVQAAVLADLTATWLAGHRTTSGPDATAAFRREIWEHHANAIWRLVALDGRED